MHTYRLEFKLPEESETEYRKCQRIQWHPHGIRIPYLHECINVKFGTGKEKCKELVKSWNKRHIRPWDSTWPGINMFLFVCVFVLLVASLV